MDASDGNDPVEGLVDAGAKAASEEEKVHSSRGANFATARPFPRKTLEQAMRIPHAIKDKNAGNAWDPREVAAVLRVGATSASYYYLTAASRDHGLTVGTRDSKAIELTDLGRQAVYPASDENEKAAARSFSQD